MEYQYVFRKLRDCCFHQMLPNTPHWGKEGLEEAIEIDEIPTTNCTNKHDPTHVAHARQLAAVRSGSSYRAKKHKKTEKPKIHSFLIVIWWFFDGYH